MNWKKILIFVALIALCILFLAKKLVLVDKSSTWDENTKLSISLRCALTATTDQERKNIDCCAQTVIKNIAQEEYFKSGDNSAMLIQNAIKNCNK
ncbi:MAG: hypothetical protein EOM49_01405 [Epsilonproteobacteria bacterium]|uniref:hypothetical protein n=1 Tax=Sulfurospirillum sp. MES TaxID=1565314 RepID=UPI00054241BB|nr:hypothetical protein [Sulfurospirillum sp. MES]KHG33200.1 MAG: hypothetical protein OA34_10910 [Sulfurospirillum sp. MES]MCD8545018.1 hypothetical protein [Sulfurospirillum cavolei]NCB53589.1 hypothetical protein [Campylobacterota bacterium]